MQLLDDFLADMRKVRPSGAISPLQEDVTTMGRSINPQGKPKAVQLPAMGADRLGMPSGYGEEGTTEREQASIAPTSSVGGQMPNYSFPAYPDFTYPSLPEHTRYPALPGVSPIPDLPPRRSAGDYPPYPEIPSFRPSLSQDISTYGGIAKTGLGVLSEGARFYNASEANTSGANPISGNIDTAMKVINPALAGFNIYNLWQSDVPTGQKVTGTVNQAIQPTSQLLYDVGKGFESAGLVDAGGWMTAASGQLKDVAPYVGIGIGAYNMATARNAHEMGKPMLDTALAGISAATAAGGPYAALFTAAAYAMAGGIGMYKRSRDERQQWTWPMHESALRADIKYALDRGQTVDINDVIGRLKQLGMKDDDINTYLDKTNFYAPLAADTKHGTWGGAWEDWRTNKDIILAAGDMTGIEGGASIRDVIMNQTGIKPITNNPNAYTRMTQQRNPNPVYDEVNFQTIDPYINVAETGFRKPIEWTDPFSMPLTDVGT